MESLSRIKRTYQPSLDTYLHRDFHPPSIHNDSSFLYQPRAFKNAATDQSVQTSLLNVGMRVRKAVGSGYQNSKSKDLSSTSPAARNPPLTEVDANKPSAQNPMHRGLEPLCGIHKIGGYGVQLGQENARPTHLSTTDAVSHEAVPKAKRPREEDTQRSATPATSDSVSPARRRILQPTSRRRRSDDASMGKSLENDIVMQDDFGEAPFLLPRE